MRRCIWLVVAIATAWLVGPIRGQGWTYLPIGQGFQSDERLWQEEEKTLDFRFISYRRNLETGSLFQDHNGLVSYVQLAVDENREQLLVGGRDVLYRLHLDNLTLLERAEWPSDNDKVQLCIDKGQNKDACHNFVRVMILVEDQNQVFTCGTNAFNPNCTWRNVNRLSEVKRDTDGRGICPYSPDYNATSLMSMDGKLYTATVIDFSARDPAILRRTDDSSYDTLRTMKGNSKWLSEPNFVSTYEIGSFVYFFFRETAVEYINCGKKIYSRVARVCKSDRGGSYSLDSTWTSYLKARLNCSLPGNFPFYFDELQSTFYSPEEEMVYAVFATPPNSIAGSAVCVYNMTALSSAFEGPYKHQENPSSAWVKNENSFGKRKCSRDGAGNKRSPASKSADAFMAAMKYQLMDRAVLSREMGPLIMRENERWTHIVVDHVPAKDGVFYDVLFLATDDGRLRKMLRLPNSEKTCLIEEIKIVENGSPRPVQNMHISPVKGAIYISMEGNILKVPVQRCYRFTTAFMCLRAQDPYCGWNTYTGTCTPAPDNNPATGYWEQNFERCPDLSYPVNGGWGNWSPWSVCRQVGLDRMVDHCLCRSRHCDSPRPANTGMECRGPSMEVSNCTVHGAWTDWSSWSACSQTCGLGTTTRTRQCGNPPPKFGGDDCAGESREKVICKGILPCPMTAVDGKWSLWSGWSACTRNCNSGIQTRKRACDRPLPMRGGMWCDGNKEEWRMCNTHRCTELSKISPWTEWIQTNRTEGGYFQQRFRFTCRANVERSKDIKTTFAKSQAQFCFKNGQGCYNRKELANTITSIDTFSSVDKVLKKYCWKRRRYLKNRYCRCRTLGVFLVCRKCELG